MILGSTIQYYLINRDLNDKTDTEYDLFDKMPIFMFYYQSGFYIYK